MVIIEERMVIVMGYDSIHETVVSDIFDRIKNGITKFTTDSPTSLSSIEKASSLARATSALTLVFPVICTNTLTIDAAVMVSKAIERKNMSLLQMAFSAYNITNAQDAIAHLSKFHVNLDADRITLDKFMDAMETLTTESHCYIPYDITRAINEDCKRNINYTLDDSINESSLQSFRQVMNNGTPEIIQESLPRPVSNNLNNNDGAMDDEELNTIARDTSDTDSNGRSTDTGSSKDQISYARDVIKSEDDDKYKAAQLKNQDIKNNLQASDTNRQYLAAQILPSDVKKANEMQPSLMLVNFYVNNKDKDLNIAQQFVCGVKSKLYVVDSSDIMNKVITKAADADILLKLIKVSTREISFVKDFLLGLDNAKLNSVTKSKKGSGAAIFNALEKRALGSKTRRTLKNNNCYKAIATVVMSMEEVEQLRKYNNIDVLKAKTIAPIMDKLCLLYFVVVDTTAEAVYMLTDGEQEFETLTFRSLERDASDSSYKQIVNLMTKIAR